MRDIALRYITLLLLSFVISVPAHAGTTIIKCKDDLWKLHDPFFGETTIKLRSQGQWIEPCSPEHTGEPIQDLLWDKEPKSCRIETLNEDSIVFEKTVMLTVKQSFDQTGWRYSPGDRIRISRKETIDFLSNQVEWISKWDTESLDGRGLERRFNGTYDCTVVDESFF